MTPKQLEAIEERANAATPGPWRRCGASPVEGCRCGLVWSESADTTVADVNISLAPDAPAEIPRPERHANGVFIAYARADMPALVAEVRRLSPTVEEARAAVVVALRAIPSVFPGKPAKWAAHIAVVIEGGADAVWAIRATADSLWTEPCAAALDALCVLRLAERAAAKGGA